MIGGTYLVFAPDDQQGFPFCFRNDGSTVSGASIIANSI